MTFDLKRRLKLSFKPDARAAAIEREAWQILIAEVRKVQTRLSVEIEDEGFEPTLRRIIEDGSPIEHVAILDGLLGRAAGLGLPRAKTLFRAVLKEGPRRPHPPC